MKLNYLNVRNFKGMREFHLDLNGQSASIYGNNGTGKTTLVDSFLWLLFGKDSTGRTDFEVKPVNRAGLNDGLVVEVEAQILPDDGAVITLRRELSEVWTRKRGDSAPVFTGHTTTYYVDSLPVTQSVYKKTVDSLIPEELFRVLTNPLYFAQGMKWQDRRRMLFETFGGVSDASIAARDERYVELLNLCGRYTVSEYKKSQQTLLKKANDELKAIPIRIDEISRSILDDDDLEPVQTRINAYEQGISALQASLHNATIDEYRKQEAELMMALTALETENEAYIIAENRQADEAYEKVRGEIMRQMDLLNVYALDQTRRKAMDEEHRIEDMMEKLRESFALINAEQYGGETECPLCHRAYDEEDVQKAVDAFEAHKRHRLDAINAEGLQLKDKLDRAKNDVSVAQIAYNKAKEAEKSYQDELASLRPEGHSRAPMPGYDDKLHALEEQLGNVRMTIKEAQSDADAINRDINEKITDMKRSLSEAQGEIAKRMLSLDARSRADELSDRQRSLADCVAGYEEMIALCEEWERVKSSAVQDIINSNFVIVKWRLFAEQINGGIQECCDPMVNGVPYSDVNGAMKINAGMDIIGAFADRNEKAAPVFVDNAESVVDLYQPDGVQVIRLVVSEADQYLRVQK